MQTKRYFGTDGVRARMGSDTICPEFLLKLGYAVGLILSESMSAPTVLIGRDTRESGELLQSALQAGLLSAGANVIALGVLPTPVVAFFTQQLRANAGIVISASHNTYEDNGVKLIGQDGLKLSDEWELRVEKKIMDMTRCEIAKRIGRLSFLSDAEAQYVAHCKKLFERLSLERMKIVLDCANGAFRAFHAEVIDIHVTPNGVNINERCGATDTTALRQKVLQEKADCGLALDGDGDRLIMIDHCGELVDGDEILCILAMHSEHAAVVGTLMSNLGLEKAIQSRGMQFERVAVGDRYVLSKLQENNWRLGGESSGHIVNLDYATTGDGVLTGLQILQIMQREKKSLQQLKNSMQKRPQVLINVPVKDVSQFSMMHALQKAAKTLEEKLGEAGRVLLRPSGTESCIRVMVECDDATEARAHAEMLASQVNT